MITRSGGAALVLHALVLLGCARAGTLALIAGTPAPAFAFYVIAAVALTGIVREVSRAALLEPAHAAPYWLRWICIRTTARRAVPACTCNRGWTSLGAEHDLWCPHAPAATP